MKKRDGTYEIFDRLLWLMQRDSVTLEEYYEKFERSRKCFIRDKEHLSLFHNINFVYSPESNKYIRSQNKCVKE